MREMSHREKVAMNIPHDSKTGTLYIVATPIGNLEDMTFRAVRILKEVSLIAAEDTRRTKMLLQTYNIRNPVTSLYDQNEKRKSGLIIAKLQGGQDVAYVSDAGTPGISDPGYLLVRRAVEHNIPVVPVPGVSAVIAALSVSGLPMDAFVFYGFLPSRAGKRKTFLQSLRDEEKTLVFYESPRRLIRSLGEMEGVFGNREVVVLREMTKVFEEIIRGTIPQVMSMLQGKEVRGEVTLVMAGRKKKATEYSDEEIRNRFEALRQKTDLSRRDMIDRLALAMGVSRKRVYGIVNIQFS